jgi:hypothetical protein
MSSVLSDQVACLLYFGLWKDYKRTRNACGALCTVLGVVACIKGWMRCVSKEGESDRGMTPDDSTGATSICAGLTNSYTHVLMCCSSACFQGRAIVSVVLHFLHAMRETACRAYSLFVG